MKKLSKRLFAVLFAVLMLVSLSACAKDPAGAAGKQVCLGTFQDGTYTNTYAGFACTLDDSWSCLTAEDLQELPENLSELLADPEADTAKEMLKQISDMEATNYEEMISLKVTYQKHSTAGMLAYREKSGEQLIDELLEDKEDLVESYKQAGIIVDSLEKTKVTFAGQECFALHMEATIQEVPYYTTQIFVFGKGLYGVTLTAASFVTDRTADLLTMFTAV